MVSVFVVSCENSQNETPILLNLKNVEAIRNHFVIPEVPEKMEFAGEQIIFQDLDIRERMDRELVVNNFWHSKTILEMKLAHRWLPVIKEILKEESLPEDLMYLVPIESGFQNVTSPSGAKGFWQIMPETAKELGLEVSKEVDERLHVEKSTKAACKYLKQAYQKFGSWTLAVASYNRGMGGMQRAIDNQKVNNFFDLYLNQETSRYVFRALAVKLVYERPENYGFYISNELLYPVYETREIQVKESISSLIDWAKEHGISYKVLKILNPWLISESLKVEEGKSYSIKLPKNDKQLKLIGV